MAAKIACPPAERLSSFLLGQIEEGELSIVAAHLEECAACQDMARTLAPQDTLLEHAKGDFEQTNRLANQVPRTFVEQLKNLARTSRSGQQSTVGLEAGPSSASHDMDFLAAAVEPDEIGRLGSYRVLDILGQGGMGMVFLAHDPNLDRNLALKVMLPKFAANETAKRRFLHEAKAAAKVKSDHIVSIHQVGEDRGVPFLAMELLEGKPLDQFLQSKPRLSLTQILRIARDTAKGLAAAHDKGLIHRDIKPGNLWLDSHAGGRVKILDFGLARAEKEDVQLTQSGAIVGTPAFMAPEQARGNQPIDARADLFSLGCVLYRLCLGELPFKSDTTMGVLLAIATEEPPVPAKLDNKIPIELSELIMQLLQKDPAKRPASAKAVLARLSEIEKKYGISAKPDSGIQFDAAEPASSSATELIPSAPTQPKPRRNRPIAVAVGGALFAAAILLAGFVFFWQTPDGVVRIESNDDAIKLAFDGGELKVIGAYKEPLTLKPGKHGLKIKRDDFEFETDKLIVAQGKEVRLRIDLLQGKVQIMQDGKGLLESRDLPAPPVVGNGILPGARGDFALLFGDGTTVKVPSFPQIQWGPITIEGYFTQTEKSTGHYTAVLIKNRFALSGVNNSGKFWTFRLAGSTRRHEVPTTQDMQAKEMALEQMLELNRRDHVAGVFDGKEMRIYVNGKQIGRKSIAPGDLGNEGATHLQIGEEFRGTMKELRISSVARYSSDFTPQQRFETDAGTLALYHCDEGDGDKLTDASGNNHHGKIVGAKWVRPSGNLPPASEAIYALQFDGRRSCVEVPGLGNSNYEPVTLEAWVKPPAQPSGSNQLVLATGGPYWIKLSTEKNHWLTYERTLVKNNHARDAVDLDRWTHVALVADGDKLKFFIDGKVFVAGKQPFSVTRPPASVKAEGDNPFFIGGASAAQATAGEWSFEGQIRSVRFSKSARYRGNFTPADAWTKDADTIALYRFEEGQGDKLTDSSGNGRHGTIVGARWVRIDSPPPLAASPFNAEQARMHQAAWAKHAGVPPQKTNSIDMPLRLIPAGKFSMGTSHSKVKILLSEAPDLKDAEGWIQDEVRAEAPVREVEIKTPFYMGAHEVTKAQFARFVKEREYKTSAERNKGGVVWDNVKKKWEQHPDHVWSNPNLSGDDSVPVIFMTPEDGQAFCDWLSEKEGIRYSLPDEQQWEYACRAGSAGDWPWGDEPDPGKQHGWVVPWSQGKLHPIGKLRENSFGLFDMVGNAAELVRSGNKWQNRGGSSGVTPQRSRSAAFVVLSDPTKAHYRQSFRVVCEAKTGRTPLLSTSEAGLAFDGKKDRVEVPSFHFDGSHPITMEGWFAPKNHPHSIAVLLGETGKAKLQLKLGADTNRWALVLGDDRKKLSWMKRTIVEAPGASNVDGRPHHVAGIWTGKKLRLFVDGKRVGEMPSDPADEEAIIPVGSLQLGFDRTDSLNMDHGYLGTMHAVRISRGERYVKDFSPAPNLQSDSDTLVLYRFDEGQGSTLKDSSGNGHHGKIIGAKWMKADSQRGSDHELMFDGSSSHVLLESLKLPADAEELTLECFITPADTEAFTMSMVMIGGESCAAITKGGTSLGGEFHKFKDANRPERDAIVMENAFAPNRRMHLAVVQKGNQTKFFVNGKEADSWVGVRQRRLWLRKPSILGAAYDLNDGKKLDFFYKGTIDELRVSKIARYSKPFTPVSRYEPDADTLALYHFDEGQGDKLVDASGNGHHGKLVDAKWVKAVEPSPENDLALWTEKGAGVTVESLKLPRSGPITLEGYVTPQNVELRGCHLFGAPKNGIFVNDNGRWMMAWWTKSFNQFSDKAPVLNNRRTHVAGVLDGQKMRLFLDGKLATEIELDELDAGTLNPFIIGSSPNWAGSFDEIRVSKVARYSRDFSPQTRFEPDADTLALYHCDEGSGDKLTDSSGNGHHGKIVGARWVKVAEAPSLDADRRAADWVLSLGGQVRFEGQDRGIDDAAKLPQGPARLLGVSLRDNAQVRDADLVRFEGCKHLIELNLGGTQTSDAGLAHFAHCKNLKLLILYGTKITDAGLASFKGCTKLGELHIMATEVGDAGLAHFKDCKGLTHLILDYTRVTDAGLAYFKDCKNLTHLGLQNTQVSDKGLAYFQECKNLQSLVVPITQVTDAGLALFKDCKNLTDLNLANTKITNAGLAHFKDCKELTWLWLHNTEVGDIGLAHFEVCKKLMEIHLNETQVSDAGLAHFKDCKNLWRLSLHKTQVGDAGLAHFKDCKNLSEVFLNETQVSDATLAQLKDYKSLVLLAVDKTKVTAGGIADFRTALPGCRIEHGGRMLEPLKMEASASNLDRRAAEFVRASGGIGRIEIAGKVVQIDAKSTLPSAPFVLRTVSLVGTKIADADLAQFEGLGGLTQLDLAGLPITDAGVKHLANSKTLIGLNLERTKITNAALADAARIESLQGLGLAVTAVTDDGLKEIAKLKNLQSLDLTGVKATRTGLDHLRGLPKLRELNLPLSPMPAKEIQEFHATVPVLRIKYDGGILEPRVP